MKLPRKFYDRDTLKVAKELLGKVLVRKIGDKLMKGIIVETEAYIGPKDKASHSYGGKKTKRNEVMYGPPGRAYVYQIYGMYYCLNVVTQKEEKPEAVLIRALEPFEQINLMAKNRKIQIKTEMDKIRIANGPGKLCKAMKIDKSLNGVDLLGNEIYIEFSRGKIKKELEKDFEICSSPRIGIDYAEEYKDVPWRFYIKGSKYVSRANKNKHFGLK